MKNNTPDFVYLQAYDQLAKDRVDFRYHKTEYGTPIPIWSGTNSIYQADKTACLKMTFQGKFIEAKFAYSSHKGQYPHLRGAISNFSPQSRGRIFDLFHKLEIKTRCTFLTLTYPDNFPDAKTAKIHLFTLLKRLGRAKGCQNASAVWRMEFQERGAPHFHLVFFKLPFIRKEKIQKVWGEIINYPEPFTRIEMIRNTRHLMSYVSKYCAKVNPSGEANGLNAVTYLTAYNQIHGDYIGRVWGVWQAANLPFAEKVSFDVPLHMGNFYRFRRLAEAKFPPIKDYLAPGFRLYVKDAKWWLDIFHYFYDIIY